MNFLIVGFIAVVFLGYANCADFPRAFNISIFLGGKKFDNVEGKLRLELIGRNITYPLALSANNEKFEYNKTYSYVFAAPYDISQIKHLRLSWTRKTTLGSYFTTKTIYVMHASLKPEYMLNPYVRSSSIHKYCPKVMPYGIKPNEVLVLSQSCKQ